MRRIKRFTVWLVTMLLIIAVIGLYARRSTQRAMLRILDKVPACAAEDGGPYPCVWDGTARGNHRGAVVIITTDP